MIDKVLAVASQVFGREVGRSDNFHALGGDSFTSVELAYRLEEMTGIEVAPKAVRDAGSFGALAQVLAGQQAGPGR